MNPRDLAIVGGEGAFQRGDSVGNHDFGTRYRHKLHELESADVVGAAIAGQRAHAASTRGRIHPVRFSVICDPVKGNAAEEGDENGRRQTAVRIVVEG